MCWAGAIKKGENWGGKGEGGENSKALNCSDDDVSHIYVLFKFFFHFTLSPPTLF